MDEFWVKYALRVCHIGSIIFLGYRTIRDYDAKSLTLENSSFFILMEILAVFSGTLIHYAGFLNTFVLNPKK